jgi:hypothetical protein
MEQNCSYSPSRKAVKFECRLRPDRLEIGCRCPFENDSLGVQRFCYHQYAVSGTHRSTSTIQGKIILVMRLDYRKVSRLSRIISALFSAAADAETSCLEARVIPQREETHISKVLIPQKRHADSQSLFDAMLTAMIAASDSDSRTRRA